LISNFVKISQNSFRQKFVLCHGKKIKNKNAIKGIVKVQNIYDFL
jgi:hypothetical protein